MGWQMPLIGRSCVHPHQSKDRLGQVVVFWGIQWRWWAVTTAGVVTVQPTFPAVASFWPGSCLPNSWQFVIYKICKGPSWNDPSKGNDTSLLFYSWRSRYPKIREPQQGLDWWALLTITFHSQGEISWMLLSFVPMISCITPIKAVDTESSTVIVHNFMYYSCTCSRPRLHTHYPISFLWLGVTDCLGISGMLPRKGTQKRLCGVLLHITKMLLNINKTVETELFCMKTGLVS